MSAEAQPRMSACPGHYGGFLAFGVLSCGVPLIALKYLGVQVDGFLTCGVTCWGPIIYKFIVLWRSQLGSPIHEKYPTEVGWVGFPAGRGWRRAGRSQSSLSTGTPWASLMLISLNSAYGECRVLGVGFRNKIAELLMPPSTSGFVL